MNEKTRQAVYDTAAILGGSMLLDAGLVIFTIPNNIAPGGVSGLATALAQLLPLSIGVLALILNAPLVVAGVIVLGWKPLAKTLVATVLCSVFIDVLTPLLPVYTNNMLLSAVLGGAMIGGGIGALFLRGLSSGGTDLLTLMLQKKFPNLPLGMLMMCIDASVVVFAVLIFRDLEVALYSGVTIFVCSKVIDSVMEGVNFAKVVYIITDMGATMTAALNAQLDRGVTVVPAKGGYSGQDKTVLMTVTRRSALAQTLRLIKQTDPHAFLFVVNAAEVHGEGFRALEG
ncbi:YitT family protein [Oscillibacter hominis]|uniref:YitT family protein n=1 Tax=Oscillibacter hominis TaxID=2763056 RepID=A0A7G9B459_9FIRM|nr:YitT family protein [Oscillibacter hominis]QNL44340.1 YitT family protein [Oscillibacter hominis]